MTGIQWTDETVNPIVARHRETGAEGWACVRVSPGCQNCYAATMNRGGRFGGTGEDFTVPALERVEPILKLERLKPFLRARTPRRVFICDMTDMYGEWVPREWLDSIWAVFAATPMIRWQVLTKRPERQREYLGDPEMRWRMRELVRDMNDDRIPDNAATWPLPNVHLGVSVEDQQRADERVPILLETPAAVRFLSVEPMLGPIDLHLGKVLVAGDRLTDAEAAAVRRKFEEQYRGVQRAYTVWRVDEPMRWDNLLHWVICGGESGAKARPFDLAWARSLRDQCKAAGVPFFMKQVGSNPTAAGVSFGRVECGACGTDDCLFGWPGYAPHVERWRRLRDRHGGDMAEWPEDLRIREFPEVRNA